MKPHRVAKPATYAELLAVPEHKVAELIDGEVYATPRPASPHAAAASALGGELHGPFQRGRGGPGGWILLDEPELHLGENVLVPDIAGWRRTRMPTFESVAYFTLAPDWVCEVLSPTTERLDRLKKLRIYAAQGIGHAWLIHPGLRSLEVYRQTNGDFALVGTFSDEDQVRAEPFADIELELGALWVQ